MLSTSQLASREAAASVGWQNQLQEAASLTDVVRVARDFLASWTPEELASLPKECRPGKLVDAEDIAGVAFNLARSSCERERISDDRLHRIANFFTAAAQRAAQLVAPGNGTPNPVAQ
jgi:hypothetical protein